MQSDAFFEEYRRRVQLFNLSPICGFVGHRISYTFLCRTCERTNLMCVCPECFMYNVQVSL